MDHAESAQKLIDATRIHSNFIREHGSIKKTPAEAANLDLNLGNNKLHELIKQSGRKCNEDHKFKLQLGKRINDVEIIDEENSIKVKARR